MNIKDIHISALQFDISWEKKEENIAKIEEMLLRINPDTDILLLPEMFTTGFSMNPEPFAEAMNGDTVSWMLEKSSTLNAVVCGSIMVQEFGMYFNRLLWVKPNGSISYYDKRHPFCLIEEGKYFRKGTTRGLFTYKDWRFFPSICYDLRFPVWLRNDLKYDVLINVANWPGIRSFAWKQMLSVRAMENQVYVVGLNRVGKDDSGMDFSGDSRIVSYDGKSIIEAKANSPEILYAVLSKNKLGEHKMKYPFQKDMDTFTLP